MFRVNFNKYLNDLQVCQLIFFMFFFLVILLIHFRFISYIFLKQIVMNLLWWHLSMRVLLSLIRVCWLLHNSLHFLFLNAFYYFVNFVALFNVRVDTGVLIHRQRDKKSSSHLWPIYNLSLFNAWKKNTSSVNISKDFLFK